MAETYVLSGFRTAKDFDRRVATWEPDGVFGDVPTAEEAAQRWLSSQDPEAQVEIIELQGNEGTVVAVVTQSGTETISY